MRLGFAIAPLLLASVPSPAAAQRVVLRERLAAQINPTGGEHLLTLGVRAPLGDTRDVLFSGAHVEAGVIDATTPIDSRNGGYLQLSPLSFLALRAEIAAVAMWSIGLDGAGFFEVGGYGADVRPQSLPGASGGEAVGTNVQLRATLQGAIPIGSWRPILIVEGIAEHEALGDAPYRYSPRHDLVLAREDWTVGLSGVALLELALSPGVLLRAGAYDELRAVPRSGYVANQIGPMVTFSLERIDPAVPEILFFVRAGAYTHHATREGAWSGVAGISIQYDAGRL
jgi:hypothetical protein